MSAPPGFDSMKLPDEAVLQTWSTEELKELRGWGLCVVFDVRRVCGGRESAWQLHVAGLGSLGLGLLLLCLCLWPRTWGWWL